MRCKIRSSTPFRGKSGYKKETVTDTFVSITVSVMVAEAGLEPTPPGYELLKSVFSVAVVELFTLFVENPEVMSPLKSTVSTA